MWIAYLYFFYKDFIYFCGDKLVREAAASVVVVIMV